MVFLFVSLIDDALLHCGIYQIARTSSAHASSEVAFKFGICGTTLRPVEGFEAFVTLVYPFYLPLRYQRLTSIYIQFNRLSSSSSVVLIPEIPILNVTATCFVLLHAKVNVWKVSALLVWLQV